MNRLIFLLAALVFSRSIAAEPVTFGFSREGLGYAAVGMPQLLNLLPSDTLFVTTESGLEFPIEVARSSRSYHGNIAISGTTELGDRFVLIVNPEGGIYGALVDDLDFYRLSTSAGVATMTLSESTAVAKPWEDDNISTGDPEVGGDSQASISEISEEDYDQTTFFNEEYTYPTYSSEPAIIDLLVYYDTRLEDPEMVLDYIFELANWTFANTATNVQIRVVATKPLTIQDDISHGELSDSMRVDSAIFDDRLFYRADLVHTVRARSASTVSGCGWAMYSVGDGQGFQGRRQGLGYRSQSTIVGVSEWAPQVGNGPYCSDLAFVHELGHNLGAAHTEPDYLDSEKPVGAYSYSYASAVPGVFRSVMGLGKEERLAGFSSPDYTCRGYPCGVAASSSGGANNTQTLRNTGRLVSSYEGATFKYDAIQEYAITGTCSDGEEDFIGVRFRNSSNMPISLRRFFILADDGTTFARSQFASGERIVEPGGVSSRGYCESSKNFPEVGKSLREMYWVYEHPQTGALVEGQRVFFDDSYSGGYSTVRASATAGGSVVGHPAITVRGDRTATINFSPNSGFVLSGVSSTCSGSLKGNNYVVQNAFEDCSVVAQFTPVASSDTVFRVSLEEPVLGQTYTGIRNLRGWALASSGIEKLEVYIDGVYQFDIPHGGNRVDVANIFPDVEGSANSGFSMAYGYSNLSEGEHVATVRAISNEGSVKDSSSTFFVTKFHKPFIGASDTVNLSGGYCRVQADSISVVDVLIDGRPYDLELQWRTAAQDFEIINID